jgi:hypothetical protein
VLGVVVALMNFLLDMARFLMEEGSTGLSTINLAVALVQEGRGSSS